MSSGKYLASYLGNVPYDLALKLQQELVRARMGGGIPDVLLLLQHPPVFTVGRFRGEEDIAVSPELLAQQGLAVFHTNRGGGVTYHGPGQLVGYPIVSLKEGRLGVRQYIWRLEEVVVNTLLRLGIHGHRVRGYPGVWVGDRKVCSIGIRVERCVTMHGFALNVNNDLTNFEYIRPCGLRSEVMTSLRELSGEAIEVTAVVAGLVRSFAEVFGLKYEPGDKLCLATLDVLNG
ncbi:MAG: lipoyl(octanoyl) transferase LipB [Chloroflexi bacterium]|nr:lipoyl(octanoyl) transferase LipB [Chloroflexota bacterium]